MTPHLYTDVSSHDELNAFFAESLIMKDFNHPNVLGLTAVCFDTPDGYPYLILPFMTNGSLKDYLKKQRVHVTDVDTCPKVCTSYIIIPSE
jgi:serine/threonine protein kinase